MLLSGVGSKHRRQIQALQAFGGLTFYKDYSVLPPGEVSAANLAADYAAGSGAATFTASRGTSNPATHIDRNGVIQKVTNSNVGRITSGFYDSTGFVSRPGLIVEGASTNLLLTSYMNNDANADGISDNYSNAGYTATGDSRVAATELSSISNFYWQRKSYTYNGLESDYAAVFNQTTAAGTASNGVTYSFSFWIKGTSNTAGKSCQVVFQNRDSGGGFLQTLASYDMSALNLSTPRRITLTGTTSHASTNRLFVGFAAISSGASKPAAGATLDFYITGLQIEALPFASTFIPTTTAALTRNAETLTYPISGNRTVDTESIFIKFTPFWNASAITANKFLHDSDDDVPDASADRRSGAILSATDSPDFTPNTSDSGSVTGTSTTDPTAFTQYVYVGTCNRTSSPYVSIGMNGTIQHTYTAGGYTANTFGTNFYLGTRYNGASTSFLDGLIHSIAIFSDAKSAANVLAISNLLAGG